MKCPTDRRSILVAAGTAILTAAVGTVAAQSTDMRGTIDFEGGKIIPQGHVDIYLEDRAIQSDALSRAAKTRVNSDGMSKAIAFSVSPPANATASSPTLQIVARLEREDGWLLARGSAQFEAGSPVHITLNTAMY